MKNIKYIFAGLLIAFTLNMFSQPDPPNGHNSSDDNIPGGDAPIGGGLFILLGLGVVYGGRKLYELKKENLEE